MNANDDVWIEWEGFEEIAKGLREADAVIVALANQAMTENAEDLLGRSVDDAPIDEGTLRGSGSVTDASTEGTIEKIIAFNMPYAAVQHECTWYNHPKGGKAKYMFDNLVKMAKRYFQNIADRIRGKIGT